MANIKSAKKRILVARKRTERNRSTKSAVKTAIKKVEAAIASNDKATAEAALQEATGKIAKAAGKFTIRTRPPVRSPVVPGGDERAQEDPWASYIYKT